MRVTTLIQCTAYGRRRDRCQRDVDPAPAPRDRAPMFVEIALLKAKSGDAERLREGLRAARAVIASAAGYQGSVFYQGVESPESFILRVEWETLEAHNEGFRKGPLFAEWRSHFQAFLDGPPAMTHYQPIAGP